MSLEVQRKQVWMLWRHDVKRLQLLIQKFKKKNLKGRKEKMVVFRVNFMFLVL